jgi:hypothetical protein
MTANNCRANLAEAERETEKFVQSLNRNALEASKTMAWLVEVRKAPEVMNLNLSEYIEKKLVPALNYKTAINYLSVGRLVMKFEKEEVEIPDQVTFTPLRALAYSFKDEDEERRLELQIEAFELVLEENEDGKISEQDMRDAIKATMDENNLEVDFEEEDSDEEDIGAEDDPEEEDNTDGDDANEEVAGYSTAQNHDSSIFSKSKEIRAQMLKEKCDEFKNGIQTCEEKFFPRVLVAAKKASPWDANMLSMLGDNLSAIRDMIDDDKEANEAIDAVCEASEFSIKLVNMIIDETTDDEEFGDHAKNMASYFSKLATLKKYEKIIEEIKGVELRNCIYLHTQVHAICTPKCTTCTPLV